MHANAGRLFFSAVEKSSYFHNLKLTRAQLVKLRDQMPGMTVPVTRSGAAQRPRAADVLRVGDKGVLANRFGAVTAEKK
jgi:hypothetical protein